MLNGLLWLVIAGAQAAGGGSPDPYEIEDPFAVEETAPTAAAPPGAPLATTPPTEGAAESSPDALICRSRPALGSRTRYFRTCMTAVQWEHHDTNMEQQRRDINDMGAVGCDPNHAVGCINQTLRGPGT